MSNQTEKENTKGFRQWNGSEWVNFEKLQHGHPLHEDEKGAAEHNKKLLHEQLKRENSLVETTDEDAVQQVDSSDEKQTHDIHKTKHHKGGK